MSSGYYQPSNISTTTISLLSLVFCLIFPMVNSMVYCFIFSLYLMVFCFILPMVRLIPWYFVLYFQPGIQTSPVVTALSIITNHLPEVERITE